MSALLEVTPIFFNLADAKSCRLKVYSKTLLMLLLLGIYILVGSVSLFTNLAKYLGTAFLVLFLPFMVLYYIIYGDAQKRAEAIMVIKGLFAASIFAAMFLGLIYFIKLF